MKTVKSIIASYVLLISSFVFAQEKTITGIVSDATGPIPGANVVVKGTNRGTSTYFDGSYSIKAKEGEKLVFSFMGMQDVTKTVGASNIINTVLQDDTQQLKEVVVTVASGIKRSPQRQLAVPKSANYHNALNNKELNFIDLLIKKQKEAVTISDEPLMYLNGKKTNRSTIANLDTKSIAEIEIVNNDDAIRFFGKKGNKGILLVTTKDLTEPEYLSSEKLHEKLDDKEVDYDSIDYSSILEDYSPFSENEFESPKQSPLSTFSIDVDNASYTNVRRFLNNGMQVPKDAVRIEEMINFFKYQYPKPTDKHPFSIDTEYSDCPWNPGNKLVRIGLQGKNIPVGNLPHSNFVFLIDVSGSMNQDNKLPLLIASLKILVKELRPKDKVSIVVYAGAAGLVLPPTNGDQKQTIIEALDKLHAGGSTAGGAGIQLAYKIAQENFIESGNNRVILATDGDFNVGASSDNDMERLIEEKRESGVFLTCLGYGMNNYKDSKMEILADKGNGNYAYIDTIQEANRFLGKEFKGSMFAIAKDVKIQIEFNPKHVQSYRLIGYENRKLRPEDFTNDAIDAGELGSGHTVTALYEIIPSGVKSYFFNEPADLKYTKTKIQESNTDELATIKFRYKKPDGNKSIEMVHTIENKTETVQNASEDFKFATAVAWFGLKLRDSKLIQNKSLEDIQQLAKQGLTYDPEGYKAEFIRLTENTLVQ
ncbi:vWA domain-containing protein [Flavobacterium sp. GCM10027622]|uniref:vWA domain-containing protein n=1 Tax=unclassified Flavobacterium TaxID=196869 RepID=UPI00361F838F